MRNTATPSFPTAYLAVENDVLAAAQHGLSAHLIAGRLRGEGTGHRGRLPRPAATPPGLGEPDSTPSAAPPPHRLDVLGLVVEHLAQLHGGGGAASAQPLPTSCTSLPPTANQALPPRARPMAARLPWARTACFPREAAAAAGPAAMEGPAGGGEALSGAEKEKVRGREGVRLGAARGPVRRGGASPVRCVLQLREKLALLRREYSETVSRLRVSGAGAGTGRAREGVAGGRSQPGAGLVSAAGAASRASQEPRPGHGGGRRPAGAEPRR